MKCDHCGLVYFPEGLQGLRGIQGNPAPGILKDNPSEPEKTGFFASSRPSGGVGAYEPVSASDYHAERAQWDAARKNLERDNLKMKKLLESIIRNDEEGSKIFAEIREVLRYV